METIEQHTQTHISAEDLEQQVKSLGETAASQLAELKHVRLEGALYPSNDEKRLAEAMDKTLDDILKTRPDLGYSTTEIDSIVDRVILGAAHSRHKQKRVPKLKKTEPERLQPQEVSVLPDGRVAKTYYISLNSSRGILNN